MTTRLTAKQNSFCVEYAITMNGTDAATKAGYAKASAHVTANNLLQMPKIDECVSRLLAAKAARTAITGDTILNALWDNHKLSLDRGETQHSNRALELLGKANRLFIDRVETTLTVYEDMSEAELDTAITQAQQDIERIQTTH